jgi:hypothetical protein
LYPNGRTAPDGTTTADLLTEDTSTNTHVIQSTFAVTSGTSYTLSAWVKQNTSVSPTRNIRLFLPSGQFGSGSAVAAGFDLVTGVITMTNSPSATSLQFYADGWVRVSVTSTCTTTGAASISLQMTSGVTTSYTGGSSGLYLWGAQFETGAFMTSYIPTTGTTATRAADVASITGSNFSSFYNQTEGTVFADGFQPRYTGQASTLCSINLSTGPFGDRMQIYMESSTPRTLVTTGGVNQAVLDLGSGYNAGVTAKLASSYLVNNFAGSFNAGTPAVDSLGTVPTVNRLEIGAVSSTAMWNGTIKRLTYWPTRLADTTLQQITQL